MKIAYFGGDWYIDCLDVFIQHDHQISHIFICHDRPYNQKLLQYALHHNIPISSEKPTVEDMMQLKEKGVDCIFSAEYSWLIPLIDDDMKSINIHPTLLPEGRGPTPIIWLLKKYREYAGITFHKLSDEFDQGDIIYQQPMILSTDESWETLVAKLNLEVPILLDKLLADFSNLYHSASKQIGGSYWPKIKLNDRRINWNDTVNNIMQLARSCGRFGIVIDIAGEVMLVNYIQVSQYQHNKPPGTLIREDDATYTMAATDGLVVIMKSNITERLVN